MGRWHYRTVSAHPPVPAELRWAFPAELESGDRRNAALAVLSPVERARYDARPSDAYLAGRMLVRTLAGELLGVPAGAVPLSAVCPDCGGPHGRPVVDGSDLRVSLSHADGLVLAAAAWAADVGVDVERSAAGPERLAAIGALAGRASVRHWTRVEAVLKADGRGLRVDPSQVLVDEGIASLGAIRYALHDLELPAGYTGSLAVRL